MAEHDNRVPIMVAVPHLGTLRVELVQWLVGLSGSGYKVVVHLSEARPLPNNMHMIVRAFLASDCQFLVKVDSDQAIVRNPLELCDLDLDVVGCPVPMINSKGVILFNSQRFNADGKLVPVARGGGLVEVDRAGGGVIVIARRVLEAIKRPFENTFDDDGILIDSDDYSFCRKAKAAGFKIWSHGGYEQDHLKPVWLLNLCK